MEQSKERIAVVEKAIEGIEKGMGRLEQKLDTLMDNIDKKYVPRQEFDANFRRLEERLLDQSDEIQAMKDRNVRVVGGLITAIVTLGAAVVPMLFIK